MEPCDEDYVMLDCLNCGKEVGNRNERWFVNPGSIIVPSQYYLCDEHKNVRYEFDDIYNNDGTRKKDIDHKKIRERS